jgi:hypothetical protein
MYRGAMHTYYQAELTEELQQGIIREVEADQCQWVSPTFLVPKPDGQWRKIMDCRLLNSYLRKKKFKMEDHQTVAELIEANHCAISIDISKAYHHVSVSDELQPYLCFQYGSQLYQYVAMPFGICSAPRIFSKIMSHAVKEIREKWNIPVVQFLVDLLFLNADPDLLRVQAGKIVTFLQNLGWTINMKKSRLEPAQRFVFLGFEWDTRTMTVKVESEKNKKLREMLRKWKKRTLRGKRVPVRDLARLIGCLSQTRMQHRRASIYLSKCNYLKSTIVQKEGWNAIVKLTPQILSEISWWSRQLKMNEPARIRQPLPTGTLLTDASPDGWGAWMTAQGQEHDQWMMQGPWREKTPRTSNFREMTAVLLGMQHFYKIRKIQPNSTVLLRSDNTATVFDINRMRAARTLIAPLKKIMNFLSERKIHLIARHIPGINNGRADKLSRMERSGDYAIRPAVLQEALTAMEAKIDIDLFANAHNKQCRRYVTVSRRAGAYAKDVFCMDWKSFRPLIHPPIPLILRC